MRYIVRRLPLFMFCIMLLFTGCVKDYTNYFADQQDEGLAIFSDKGNNLMTAYIDNKPWRTHSRTTALFGGIRYEITFYRHISNSPSDTLFIQWQGDLTANNPSPVYQHLDEEEGRMEACGKAGIGDL